MDTCLETDEEKPFDDRIYDCGIVSPIFAVDYGKFDYFL